MDKQLARLFLVLVLAVGAHAQILQGVMSSGSSGNSPYLQGCNALQASGTSATCTFGVAVGAGHGLAIFCVSTANCTTPTATGETLDTFTGASGCQDFGADAAQCWLTHTTTVGGETSVACTTASAASIVCIAIEFTRPQALATPKDAGGHGATSGATSLAVSTSAATTNASDFVIACFGSFGTGNNAVTLDAPYTSPAVITHTDANGQMSCGYSSPGSTGTQSSTGRWSSSMRANGMILAVKP